MSYQEQNRLSFEEKTSNTLEKILERIAEIDKSNAELNVKFGMLEKSLNSNLSDLTGRVNNNQRSVERLEEKHDKRIQALEDKYEKKISDLEKDHNTKIDKLSTNQSKIIGAIILCSALLGLAIKFI